MTERYFKSNSDESSEEENPSTKMEEESPAQAMQPEESPEKIETKREEAHPQKEKPAKKTAADKEKEALRQQYMKESLKTYQLLKKNIFLDRKRRVPTEDDLFECECQRCDPNNLASLQRGNPNVSYNCGDRCLNRYVCTECEENSCPSKEYCQNRRFQLHQDSNVFPKPSGGKGWGLFAGEYIKKGSFVMQYIGEIFNVNSEEGQTRVEAYSVDKISNY